ncbi:MAG TPA: hypothetical protein VK753_07320 [Xanthomonadaceae bacterium]|jgi:DNA-directed RNA polymerase specialized sigma24 family protein|nr:hypothetical protein [Xanthomonadaceae bacterium]
MTARPSPPRTDTTPIAFVRGIEQHGLVLAETQCADTGRARAAVASCKADFHEQAAALQSDEWPCLYWRILLAQPAMRAAIGRDPDNPFSLLDPGPRAALLLRLVAGLDQMQGAEAMDVSPEAYRHALYRALEILRAKGIDESWMRALRDRLRLDSTPTHAVTAPRVAADAAVGAHAAHATMPRWLRPALFVALGSLVLAGIGSFFWQPAFLKYGTASANGIETLREHKPAEILPATANLVSGADFDLLADPQGAGVAHDLDLYAWYAATANAPAASPNPSAPPLPETTLPETSAPDADAEPAEGGNAP